MARAPALFIAFAALLAAPAPARPPATGDELVLDPAAPIVEARIGAASVRLRVDLEARDVIELNTAVLARTGLHLRAGFAAAIGPIELPGVQAPADVAIGGYRRGLVVSHHGRDVAVGADGTIGPALLPYRRIRFVRAGPPAAGETETILPLRDDDGALTARFSTPKGTLLLQFSLANGATVATAAAGARLAALGDGHLVGGVFPLIGPFGLPRPSRMLHLARPVMLGGFAFQRLVMRLGDFRGDLAQPAIAGDAPGADDILVEGRRKPDQFIWPVILVGHDRLDRCREILFERDPLRLTLRCAPPLAPAAEAPHP